jgi:predicted metalloprotease
VNVSRIIVCLAATAALALSACGDDDDESKGGGSTATTATQEQQQGSASGAALTDVEPRSAKPNLAGGDAPIESFVNQYADDAVSYWRQVFENSQQQYQQPTVTVVTSGTGSCGADTFDPAKGPGIFFCASDQSAAELFYGPAFLSGLREQAGDGAVAFLVGFAAAADANNQVSGNPIGGQQEVGDDFFQLSGCFTGAWIRNLNDRQVLQEGDDQEILNLAGQFLPGADETVGKKAVALGHDSGVGACQQQYGGGGEPAPSDG